MLDPLIALSPLEGRYADNVTGIRDIMSEYGLIKQRIRVEIAWLIFLCDNQDIPECPMLNSKQREFLYNLSNNFNIDDAKQVKIIEKEIKHDVKSVEYFLRQKLTPQLDLKKYWPFLHFGCTSEDINSTAYGLMLQSYINEQLWPFWKELSNLLKKQIVANAKEPMLARTHGQPASPTTLGKEWLNVHNRFQKQFENLIKIPIYAKWNGAVGNYHTYNIAYPELDWPKISKTFLEDILNLTYQPFTTQIEPHDELAAWCDNLSRITSIGIDFCRDIWGYISLGYFQQINTSKQVGSSTMPHKINPIDFENAEGNFGIANALLNFFSTKLPISRWQRDLSDSTVLRNLGIAFGYSQLAFQKLYQGLSKLQVNKKILEDDLNRHWEVLSEPIQTIMRKHGIIDAYEQLKSFSQGKIINKQLLSDFINSLDLPNSVKEDLKKLSPTNYLGLAIQQTMEYIS